MDAKPTRGELLEEYREGAGRFDRFIEGDYAEELLNFRPSLDGAWTIHEHLIHMLDSEINGFIRYRKAVAEPGTAVGVYDQVKWQEDLDYSHQSLKESLEIFKRLRFITYHHLKSLPAGDWEGSFMNHPERGKVSLDQWLEIYTAHVGIHLDYIKRNEELWRK